MKSRTYLAALVLIEAILVTSLVWAIYTIDPLNTPQITLIGVAILTLACVTGFISLVLATPPALRNELTSQRLKRILATSTIISIIIILIRIGTLPISK